LLVGAAVQSKGCKLKSTASAIARMNMSVRSFLGHVAQNFISAVCVCHYISNSFPGVIAQPLIHISSRYTTSVLIEITEEWETGPIYLSMDAE